MKKSHRKIALRKETLRALSSVNLARAVGGSNAPLVGDLTHENGCPLAALAVKA